MRIVLVTDGIRIGRGIDVAASNLAAALDAAGHEVVLCGGSALDVRGVLGSPPRFRCVRLDPLPGGVRRRAAAVCAVAPRLADLRGDCYVPVSFPYDQLAGRLDAPVVLYDHGAVPGRWAPPRTRLGVRAVAGYAIRARRRAQGVITISNWLRERMARWMAAERIRVVPNGVDHAARLANLLPARAAARDRFGLAPDAPIVLAVARCGPEARYKGVHQLGSSLRSRGFAGLGGVLVVAGRADADDRSWLSEHAVTALGTLTEGELAAAYAAADVHVSASTFEGFNLPLLEAQWLGVPVLAVDRCAHPEVVADRSFLVPDVDTLADRIVARATGNEVAAQGALERAQQFARGFTWQRAARHFGDALGELIR